MDLSAIGMSGLCLVHCLASGVFVAGLSAVSMTVPASHEFHLYALLIAAVLALWALGRGWVKHRRAAPMLLGSFSLGLMALGVLPSLAGWPETVLTVLGVAILAVAHVLNWRGLHHHGAESGAGAGAAVCTHDATAATCDCPPSARLQDAA
ncbi:MerC domain-containing protein [Pedomonas mirosovicensis]|uniref:MerC domain-containing protein n=1 Tax=Pedomonas mirosovicensis TaxID=2908641 RepID=UPI002169EF75|nr:MerC domain-containing protein [Pedomonas mirosovicensis]MCH8685921.1 MerC domain-containing protein [Pedomonas mirosovicensis]